MNGYKWKLTISNLSVRLLLQLMPSIKPTLTKSAGPNQMSWNEAADLGLPTMFSFNKRAETYEEIKNWKRIIWNVRHESPLSINWFRRVYIPEILKFSWKQINKQKKATKRDLDKQTAIIVKFLGLCMNYCENTVTV